MDFEADGDDTRTRAEAFHEDALHSIMELRELRHPYRTAEAVEYLHQRIQTFAALATMEYARITANQHANAERNAFETRSTCTEEYLQNLYKGRTDY